MSNACRFFLHLRGHAVAFACFTLILLVGGIRQTSFQESRQEKPQQQMQQKQTKIRHHSKRKWGVVPLNRMFDRFYSEVKTIFEVNRDFKKTSSERSVPSDVTKKVAYLFMVKDGVDQKNLWLKFFRGAAPESFSIYFHQYQNSSKAAEEARSTWRELGAQFIPYVDQGWGYLAGLQYALLWEALRDPANAQFVFLSPEHVPFKSASYVYRYLMRSSDDSKLCLNKPTTHTNDVTAFMESASECSYRDLLKKQKLMAKVNGEEKMVEGRVRKHHQWVILSRRHAVDVMETATDALRQRIRAVLNVPMFGGEADATQFGASDEAFIATALLLASEKAGRALENSADELVQEGVRSECTTFVYWKNCFTGSALDAHYGWNASTGKDLKTLVEVIKQEKKTKSWKKIFNKNFLIHPTETIFKKLNDLPRNYGKTGAQPDAAYVKVLVDSGFLFGRKFGKDEFGQLSRDYTDELPPLWDEFEANFGPFTEEKLERESKLWPVLDSGDSVVKMTLQARAPIPSAIKKG